jgi:hypothetical protein
LPAAALQRQALLVRLPGQVPVEALQEWQLQEDQPAWYSPGGEWLSRAGGQAYWVQLERRA